MHRSPPDGFGTATTTYTTFSTSPNEGKKRERKEKEKRKKRERKQKEKNTKRQRKEKEKGKKRQSNQIGIRLWVIALGLLSCAIALPQLPKYHTIWIISHSIIQSRRAKNITTTSWNER